MDRYIRRKDKSHVKVLDKYIIQGFISSGTYGKVYKARGRKASEDPLEFAIKKFKAEKEGESATYSGLSQSACREMSLCRELKHDNIVDLQEIILEDKCIYMIFEFYEYDLLQIIHYHLHQPTAKQKIPDCIVRGILYQLLQGVAYLHENWVMHRDLKPANIMITREGRVKIGDLGLARMFYNPLQPLYTGDKVVVTIWYRAPELLLGSKHYGPAIDLWAIGCIFAELMVLRPLFKGDEIKVDNKKTIPFQRNQVTKIIEILGTPNPEKWLGVEEMPDYHQLKTFRNHHFTNQLPQWYRIIGAMASTAHGLKLLESLLEYDPEKRATANEALAHHFFAESPKVTVNVFDGQSTIYPNRQIKVEDSDMNRVSGQAAPAPALAPATSKAKQNSGQMGQTTSTSATTMIAGQARNVRVQGSGPSLGTATIVGPKVPPATTIPHPINGTGIGTGAGSGVKVNGLHAQTHLKRPLENASQSLGKRPAR